MKWSVGEETGNHKQKKSFIIYIFFRAPKEEPGNQGWMGYFGKALMTPASYLPSQVTEVFSQGRAFAVAKLPRAGL